MGGGDENCQFGRQGLEMGLPDVTQISQRGVVGHGDGRRIGANAHVSGDDVQRVVIVWPEMRSVVAEADSVMGRRVDAGGSWRSERGETQPTWLDYYCLASIS
jgi:hypothetical protein